MKTDPVHPPAQIQLQFLFHQPWLVHQVPQLDLGLLNLPEAHPTMEKTESREDSLLYKYVKIAAVVSLYWAVSISMVFVNKTLLGGANMGEKDAPLFVTAFQCAVTAIACLLLTRLAKLVPHIVTFPEIGGLEKEKVKKVLPLTVVFVSMISMNNFCLKYVGVSFYYVGRSLTTVFNVLFTYLILGQKTSVAAMTCCAIIVAGFFLGVDQEGESGSLSLIGVLFGVLASASVSLNAIFTKRIFLSKFAKIWIHSCQSNIVAYILILRILKKKKENQSKQIFVWASTGNRSLWTLLVVLEFQGWTLMFWLITGLEVVTSPLTHNISGTAKACAQTVLATWLYSEDKSGLWWLSNWTVLGGSLAYTKVKQLEMKSQHNKAQQQASLTKDQAKY
ncbi:unnamed protein product, partial [Meganyctiphanes norvegica]